MRYVKGEDIMLVGGGAWAVSLSSATCHVTARGPSCIYPLGSSSP